MLLGAHLAQGGRRQTAAESTTDSRGSLGQSRATRTTEMSPCQAPGLMLVSGSTASFNKCAGSQVTEGTRMCKKRLMVPTDLERERGTTEKDKQVCNVIKERRIRMALCQRLMNHQRYYNQGHLWRRASPRPIWIYVQEGCKLR